MSKKKIRSIVYRNDILRILWIEAAKFKVKYRHQHRKTFNYFYYFYLIKIKGYRKVTFDKKIINGIFRVFINEETSTVVKVIRRDNNSSTQFYHKLKDEQNYENYYYLLNEAVNMEFLGENITKVLNVYRDGGYESPYVHGENLQVLMEQMMENEYSMTVKEYEELLIAIDGLYRNLYKHYTKYGSISGDWMLHNLVYNPSLKKIVNVDLEGFYTWREKSLPNNITRIKKDFDEIKKLILHKLSSPAISVNNN